jgi:hypothetical protein
MSNPYLIPADNPVLVLQPLHQGNTRFTWGTGDSSHGEVLLSIDGGPQTLFSPVAGQTPTNRMPPIGNPNMPLPAQNIQLGKQYFFKLYKKGDRLTPLAQVTVTAQSVSDTAVGTVAAGSLGFIQLIQDLKVVPGPEYVDFSFATTQPSMPLIQLSTSVPGPGPAFDPENDEILSNPLPSLFFGLQMRHQLRVGPPKLAQNTTYFFIITAASTTHGDRPTTVTGRFTTATRSALVQFEHIRVWRDGDPGGSGEMVFLMSVYDGHESNRLSDILAYPDRGYADIGDGDYVAVNREAMIENAPATLTLYTFGMDDDAWGVAALLDINSIRYTPNSAPGREQGEDEMAVWASAQETYDLPTNSIAGPLPHVDFAMESENGGVSFAVSGKIITTVTPGLGFGFRRVALRPRMAVARALGLAAAVVTGPGRVDMFVRGPDNDVYRKTIDRPVRGTSRSEWQRLGVTTAGPITALSVEDGGLYLFVPGPDGTVLCRSWDTGDGTPSSSPWHDLGGYIVGQITALASAHDYIHLFALDASGEGNHCVVHCRDGEPPRTVWENLGGKFSAPVAAISSQEGRIDIFALGHGGVYHKSWYGGSWTPAQYEWEDLGGEFNGSLVAIPEADGRFYVFAFVADGTVYRKVWDGGRWEPSQLDWEKVGTVASLSEEMAANGRRSDADNLFFEQERTPRI